MAQPLQETAYEHIRSQILSGQLRPNTLYSETKMAAELHISRTPIKDALVRLSQDRLIDIIPSKGFRLHAMSSEDIWSTYQARTAVEGFCAMHLARSRQTPSGQAVIREMETCQAAMDRFLEEGSSSETFLETFLEYDLQFHQILVDFSQNEELQQLFRAYHYRLQLFALESLRVEGRPQAACREHREILRAIAAPNDAAGMQAYLAIMHHMEITRDIMLSI